MALSSLSAARRVWQSFLDRLFARRKPGPWKQPTHGFRPTLEHLECRLAPATLTVNTILDNNPTLPGDQFLSLREAVLLIDYGGNSMAALGRSLSAGESAQINTTNPFGNSDTILFDGSLTGQTITLSGTELLLGASMTITGPAAGNVIVDGNDASRLFHIESGNTVTIANLTITGGQASGPLPASMVGVYASTGTGAGGGGGILNEAGATLILNHDTISNNQAIHGSSPLAFTVVGGGLLNLGTATVQSCQFSNNQASGGNGPDDIGGSAGGAIDNFGGPTGGATFTATATTFSNNSAVAAGGGYYFGIGGALELNAGLNFYNPAQAEASAQGATITNCTFTNNLATGGRDAIANGGAIDEEGIGLNMTLVGCTINGNRAVGGNDGSTNGESEALGGGIMNIAATLNIAGCTITNNQALGGNNAIVSSTDPTAGGGFGGGIDATATTSSAGNEVDSVLNISNSVVAANVAQCGTSPYGAGEAQGGGIDNQGSLTSSNCTIAGNSALGANTVSVGGGFFNASALTVSNCTISGNAANYSGGIGNAGTLTVSSSTITGNSATGLGTSSGGGIGMENNTTSLVLDSTIANNTAVVGGGIASADGGTLIDTIVADNHATSLAYVSTGDINGNGLLVGSDNLIGDGTFSGFTNGVKGNQVGTTANPLDPMLGPLTDNGGPTQTMGLLPGSPAIHAGGPVANLSNAIGVSATTIAVNTALASSNFADQFVIQINSEQVLVHVDAAKPQTLDVDQRGYNRTSAVGHNGGAGVFFAADQRGQPRVINGQTDIGAVELTLNPIIGTAPAILSAASATFVVGMMNSFSITTSGIPAPTAFSETGTLPDGVGLTEYQDGTATLSGTPPAVTGTYVFNITASNGIAPDAVQVFTLTVIDPPTFTTSVAGSTFVAGTAIKPIAVKTKNPLPTKTTLSISPQLPAGLTFTHHGNGTATIAGTPEAGLSTQTFTISATNTINSTATQTFTLTIDQKPAFTSAAIATFAEGQTTNFKVTTTGFPTATLTASSLPLWATFTDNHDGTGILTGTPPAGTINLTPITIPITLTATGSTAVPQSFTLTVTQAPTFQGSTPITATFTVGTAGPAVTVATTAGVPAKTTLSISPKLPAGLTFTHHRNGTATITGTPAAGTGGAYDFTITARNAVGAQATQSCQITIDQEPAFISAASVNFAEGQTTSFKVKTTGFPMAALTASSLPLWSTFTDDHDGTGILTGTPPAGTISLTPITISITLTATGLTAVSQSFNLIVTQAPTFQSSTPISATFTVGTAGPAVTVATTAGVPAKTTLSISPNLPAGLTFTHHNGTATITGTPAAGTGGAYAFTITASNAVGSQATQSCQIIIDEKLAFTSATSSHTFVVGQSGTFKVSVTGFPTPTLTATALPAGLRFVDNHDGTGTISGTPEVGTGGRHSVTFLAQNTAGVQQIFTLIVDTPPIFTGPDSATITVAEGQSVVFISANGLPAVTTYTETGSLPAGFTLFIHSNGVFLIGIPKAANVRPTPYTFTISATDGLFPPVFEIFELTIA